MFFSTASLCLWDFDFYGTTYNCKLRSKAYHSHLSTVVAWREIITKHFFFYIFAWYLIYRLNPEFQQNLSSSILSFGGTIWSVLSFSLFHDFSFHFRTQFFQKVQKISFCGSEEKQGSHFSSWQEEKNCLCSFPEQISKYNRYG